MNPFYLSLIIVAMVTNVTSLTLLIPCNRHVYGFLL